MKEEEGRRSWKRRRMRTGKRRERGGERERMKGNGDEIEKKSEKDETRDSQSLPKAESQVERIKIWSTALGTCPASV